MTILLCLIRSHQSQHIVARINNKKLCNLRRNLLTHPYYTSAWKQNITFKTKKDRKYQFYDFNLISYKLLNRINSEKQFQLVEESRGDWNPMKVITIY